MKPFLTGVVLGAGICVMAGWVNMGLGIWLLLVGVIGVGQMIYEAGRAAA